MNAFGVVLFFTSSGALRAEKTCTRAGLTVKLIPTPRELSSDCGISLRFDWSESERVRTLLAGARVEVAGIHELQGGKRI